MGWKAIQIAAGDQAIRPGEIRDLFRSSLVFGREKERWAIIESKA